MPEPGEPGYKYSVNNYISDGSQRTFEVSFSDGYISRDHVKVEIISPLGLVTVPSWSWAGNFTIVLAGPASLGHTVRIRRQTPISAPLVDFSDSAIINEQSLDINARQAIFVAQEYIDAANSAYSIAELNDIINRAILAAHNAEQMIAVIQDLLDGFLKDDGAWALYPDNLIDDGSWSA